MSGRIPWQAKFAALGLIWGSSFFLMKVGLEALAPIQIATLRILSGALTLLVVGSLTGVRMPRDRRVWLHLVVSGFLLCSLPFTLFPLGEERVTSALAGIGNATTPLAAVLFTLLLLPVARPSRRVVVALVVGFVGVLVIAQPWQAQGRPDLFGFGMTLLAGLSYGLGWTYLKRFLGPGDVGGLSLPAAQLFIASVQMLLVAAGWWWLHRDALPAPWSTTAAPGALLWPVLAMLALGVIGTGVAYALQFDVVREVGPTIGTSVTYLIPVVAVALGIVFLHERLAWPQAIGAGIVLSAAVVIGLPDPRLRRGRRRASEPPTDLETVHPI